MQFEKSKSVLDNYKTYFSYFNNSFFVDQNDYSEEEEEEINLSDDSSTNISQETINSIEDEEKLIPHNLLDLNSVDNPITDNENIEKNENKIKNGINKVKPDLQKYILPKSLFDSSKKKESNKLKKNLDAKPYIPIKFKYYPFFMPAFQPFFFNNIQNFWINQNMKKQELRKGNWLCTNCRNINFNFRSICNKCGTKKCLEKKLFEIGEDILKLANISIEKKI